MPKHSRQVIEAVGACSPPLRSPEQPVDDGIAALAWHSFGQRAHPARGERRYPVPQLPQPEHPEVPVIAREKLVAAVTRERHGHVAACKPGQQQRGDLRAVRERLIEEVRNFRNEVECLPRRAEHLGVLRAEMTGDIASLCRFVETRVFESDGEGLHAARRARLHQCGDQRRVDAAGKERTERHVGHELPPYRIERQFLEGSRYLFLAALERVARACARVESDIPIADRCGTQRRIEGHDRAR